MKKSLVFLAVVIFSGTMFSQEILFPVQNKLSDCAWPTSYVQIVNGLALCPTYVGGVPNIAVAVNQGPFSLLTGQPGQAATVRIGSVTSGPSASVTNSGTPTDAILDFILAQGDKGLPGVLPGNTLTGSGSMTCSPSSGTVPKGFVCVFKDLVLKVASVQ